MRKLREFMMLGKWDLDFVFISTLKGEIFIVVQMVIDERLRANMII